MKAYVYILNGKVVINPEPEPDTTNYGNDAVKAEYNEWESNCIVVNKASLIRLGYHEYREENTGTNCMVV